MIEATSAPLETIREPILDGLRRVEEELRSMVPADFDAIDEVNAYLFSARGKLLRPTLLLLASRVGGRPGRHAVRLAAIVELMHVATLVHDDAVDHSVRRRGMPTVNARWTHQVAIIMGDYLYSRALVEVSELGELEAIRLLARTSNHMTIGEMRQLVAHDSLDFSPEDYYRLCEHKTASLMSAACELGAMAGAREHRAPLRDYGYHLGMAFQITDDLLDYTSPAAVTGKPCGQDLREHKVTLPLIAALPAMRPEDRCAVRHLFEDPEPGPGQVDEVIDAVERVGGLTAARREAERFAEAARGALRGLPAGRALEALRAGVEYVLERER